MINVLSPEEINAFLKTLLELGVLILGTSVGTFTRELIFPKDNSFKENIGLSLVSGFLAFGLSLRYPMLTIEYMFLICFFLGFSVPLFKDWLKDKKLFRIFFKALAKTNDLSSSAIEQINKELEKEEEV